MIHPLRVRIGLVRSDVLLGRGFDYRRLGQAGISASAQHIGRGSTNSCAFR